MTDKDRWLPRKLSGDMAHELFMSNEPFPLHDWLDAWRAGTVQAEPGYVIAVCCAYRGMLERCRDGRYGKIRGA
jgi:hypothetical protein